MQQIIRDGQSRIIGYINDCGAYLQAFDGRMHPAGWYYKNDNRTLNKRMEFVGYGNLLAMLLTPYDELYSMNNDD